MFNLLPRIVFLAAALALFLAPPAHAQSPEAEEAWAGAYDAYQEMRFDEAERLIRQALVAMQDEPLTPDSPRAECMDFLASILVMLERYDEAIETYREIFRAYDDANLPEDERDWAQYSQSELLSNIAHVRERQGDFEAAAKAIEEYREFLVDYYEGDPSAEGEPNARLGRIRLLQGRPEEALEAFERALPILEEEWGARSPWLAEIIRNIGEANLELGRLPEAEQVFRRMLSLVKMRDGAASEHLLYPYSKIAFSLLLQEKWADAADAYEEALVYIETYGGSSFLDRLWAHQALAQVEECLGDLDSALKHIAEVIAITERHFGEESPDLAEQLDVQSRLLRELDREADADAAEARAKTIRESIARRSRR